MNIKITSPICWFTRHARVSGVFGRLTLKLERTLKMSIDSIKAAIAVLNGEPVKPERKLRDCQLCGSEKSVGKYYVSKSESENYGWWRVCSHCAEMVSRVGADVQYYKYTQEYRDQLNPPRPTIDHPDCKHKWEKWSLVSEIDKRTDRAFDWMRCTECQCFGNRYRLDQIEMSDLCMEIDLNCSR